MAYEKIYSMINWKNLPDKSTPVNAPNLGKMDSAIDTLDTRIAEMSATNPQNTMEKAIFYTGKPSEITGKSDVEAAYYVYKGFNLVVFWDDYVKPSKSEYPHMVEIISRLKEKQPEIKVAGRISFGMDLGSSRLTMDEVKEYIDAWQTAGAGGIFFDKAGYNKKVTRERQNEAVAYVKGKGMFVMMSAGLMSHIFSGEPRTVDGIEYNSNRLPCLLDENDYAVMSDLFYEPKTASADETVSFSSPNKVSYGHNYFEVGENEYDGMSYYEKFGTRIVSFNQIPKNMQENSQKILQTIAFMGASISNIQCLAFQYNDKSYYPWSMPEECLSETYIHPTHTEQKAYLDSNGNKITFTYKWSADINGNTYALIYDVPDAYYKEWQDDMRYVTINGKSTDNLWATQLDIQAMAKQAMKAAEKAAEGANSYHNPYTQKWIDERKADIAALQKLGHCITFVIMTDIHVRMAEDANAGRFNLAKDFLMIADQIPVDYICCCGDIMSYTQEWDGLFEPRTKKIRDILSQARCPWFAVRGNHDFNNDDSGDDGSPDSNPNMRPFTLETAGQYFITGADWRHSILSGMDERPGISIVYDETHRDAGYFYVDDYILKHRMIFTAAYEPHETELGRPYLNTGPGDCWTSSLKTLNQINWLMDKAMDMTGKTDWIVSFFGHKIPYTDKEEADRSEFHGYDSDNAPLRAIVKAFQDGSQVTGLKYTVLNKDTHRTPILTVNKDFSGQGPIAVSGWFSGHIHDDCYKKVDGLNLVVSTCTANMRRVAWSNDMTPAKLPPERNSTDLAMSINLVIVNRDTRTINVVKLGSKRDNTVRTSSDYEFTY